MDAPPVATLGPAGTCSDVVVHGQLLRFAPSQSVMLCASYEEAVSAVETGTACAAVIAAAYPRLNNLIFKSPRTVSIVDCFVCATPRIVAACRKAKDRAEPFESIACFAAVVPLAQAKYTHSGLVPAASNSAAAAMVAKGETDAAITTELASASYGLEEVYSFGSVSMAWIVLRKLDFNEDCL